MKIAIMFHVVKEYPYASALKVETEAIHAFNIEAGGFRVYATEAECEAGMPKYTKCVE